MKKQISMTGIDRAVIGFLAALVAASGLYLVGPWYLEEANGKPGPVYYLTQSDVAVTVVGGIMLVAAYGLFYSVRKGVVHARILTASLLATFLVRLYVLIGTMFTLESWRPPGYLSAAFATLVAGAYWVWFKVRKNRG